MVILLSSQNSSMMPEVRDLSDALPEMPMDPITGVGVVASRNRAPTGYDVVRDRPHALIQMQSLYCLLSSNTRPRVKSSVCVTSEFYSSITGQE